MLATLGLTLGLGAYLPQLRVDNSGEAMLRADDQARLNSTRTTQYRVINPSTTTEAAA